jgi:glycosyltransferase involved in cell wall biosynthesis
LPTVAFDTPVAREYLGLDGLLAVRGDVESLAAKLRAALAFEGHAAQEMGQRLRQRALQQFAWDQAGQLIVATYRALIARRRGGPVSESMPAIH